MEHQVSNILVTGGTGFLGAYILKELVQQGYTVRALKREKATLPGYIEKGLLGKIEWITGDILDIMSLEDAMANIDAVIHCAAIVSFAKEDRKSMYHVNVDGTANVVNTALSAGIRRFVYISSVAALGRKRDSSRVDEHTQWQDSRVNTHYAISKFKAELEVWRGFAEGLNGVVLNPATILGYGDWHHGSNALFKNVYEEFGWYSGGLNGFADVTDVARAAVALMNTAVTEERFIVCNDNWRFRKLLDTIADAFGKKRPHRQATPFWAGLAWRWEKLKSFFSGTKPLVTKESAKVANSETVFDGSRLLQALPGFAYRPLEETIRDACSRYLLFADAGTRAK